MTFAGRRQMHARCCSTADLPKCRVNTRRTGVGEQEGEQRSRVDLQHGAVFAIQPLHTNTVLSVLNPQAGGLLHIFGSVPSTSCVPCTSMLATDSLLVCWLLTHSFDCSQAYSRLQQTAVSKVQPFLRGSCRHQVLHSVGVATDTFALSHQNPRSPKRSKQSFWAPWYGEGCGP